MALTNDQLKLLESCPALVAFKDWFVEVDALLDGTETTEPTEPTTETTEPTEPTDGTEGT